MGSGCEGFFTDELTSEDSDLTAKERIVRIENLYLCSAVDQEEFFSGDQKGNPEIVLGRFAIALLTQNFLRRWGAGRSCALRRHGSLRPAPPTPSPRSGSRQLVACVSAAQRAAAALGLIVSTAAMKR